MQGYRMEEVTEAPAKKQRLAVLPEGHAGDGGRGTPAKPLTDHGEGTAGDKHGQCEEEVQLRVRVQNSADEVVVRVRPEKVDLTGHRGLIKLPEEMRRCAVRVRELAVASSALEMLPEWLGELVRLEVLRLGHTTLERAKVRFTCTKVHILTPEELVQCCGSGCPCRLSLLYWFKNTHTDGKN
jgi:hypothetical protein